MTFLAIGQYAPYQAISGGGQVLIAVVVAGIVALGILLWKVLTTQ